MHVIKAGLCKRCYYRDYLGAYSKAHPQRGQHFVKAYGITLEDAEALLASQGGCCKLCAVALEGLGRKAGQVDHCHKTGRVRGVLCRACNTSLGGFERWRDSPSVIDYLTGR